MKRRQLLQTLSAGLALTALGPGRSLAMTPEEPVHIGLTPVFLDDQAGFLANWRDYLSTALQRPVVFIQRASYREVIELLRQEQLQFAWVCGYPFVRSRQLMRLLAVPVYQGQPLYRSYIIVPARDRGSESIVDLRDRIFAYADPDSNSGYLYANYRIAEAGFPITRFFRRTFFTYSHKKVVEAVALGIADGGAVDGYVWDTLARIHPELTGATRVIQRSPEFGFPPLVASRSVTPALFEQMQALLLGMEDDPTGAHFLTQLNLDRFTLGAAGLYAGIAEMVEAMGEPLERG